MATIDQTVGGLHKNCGVDQLNVCNTPDMSWIISRCLRGYINIILDYDVIALYSTDCFRSK